MHRKFVSNCLKPLDFYKEEISRLFSLDTTVDSFVQLMMFKIIILIIQHQLVVLFLAICSYI